MRAGRHRLDRSSVVAERQDEPRIRARIIGDDVLLESQRILLDVLDPHLSQAGRVGCVGREGEVSHAARASVAPVVEKPDRVAELIGRPKRRDFGPHRRSTAEREELRPPPRVFVDGDPDRRVLEKAAAREQAGKRLVHRVDDALALDDRLPGSADDAERDLAAGRISGVGRGRRAGGAGAPARRSAALPSSS